MCYLFFFFFQAEDGIRDTSVTGVQTCALPILISLFNQSIDFQASSEFFALFGTAKSHPPSSTPGRSPTFRTGGGAMPHPVPHGILGASLGCRARMLTVSLICIDAMPCRSAARGSGKLRLVVLSTFSMSR